MGQDFFMECESCSNLRTEPGFRRPVCRNNAKSESRNRNEQSSGGHCHLKCAADGEFGEIRLDRIPNLHCKSVPSRTREASPVSNAVLIRGSMYHSSGEVRRMLKLEEGRRKIDSRDEGDALLSFETVDSLPLPSIRECDVLDPSFRDLPGTVLKPDSLSVDLVDAFLEICLANEMLDPIMTSESPRSSLLIHTATGRRNAVLCRSLQHDFSKTMQRTESNGWSGREDRKPSAAASSPAHLHATLRSDYRNGTPAFEFCVKDYPEDDLLSAKTWRTDNAFNQVYTFHRHSKRSPSKHGVSPPIVGQMQASCCLCSPASENGAVIDSAITEFILYDVAQAGHDSSYPCSHTDLHPHLETAAIVIQIPFHQMGPSIKVITPSGLHGLPSTDEDGSPSSLLDRWRYGGGCDCGGWDMACPLAVFDNDAGRSRVDGTMLFIQGSKEQAPVLSMTAGEKGLYSIDFHGQLSVLQAFSICVALLQCFETCPHAGQEKSKHKSCLNSWKLLLEEEVRNLIEAVANEENMKTKKVVEPAVPPSFMFDPPFSPMGRV